jgi:hypothetical protein
VPPPAAHQPLDDGKDAGALVASTDQILTKLRNLADPEVTQVEPPRGLHGGVAGPGRPVSRPSVLNPARHDEGRAVYQTRLNTLVAGSADVTAQAIISHDRRHVRLNLSGMFNVLRPGPVRSASVVLPIFPGGVAPRP